MKRKVLIGNGYYLPDTASKKEKSVFMNKYDLVAEDETMGGTIQVSFTPNLSVDVDIFSELPRYVYNNKDAHIFLNVLRNVLLSSDLEGITLSKLCVSEHSASGIVLDWIYNYFRIYFSFDSEDGNFYGIISNNPEEGSYSNEFKAMNSRQYESISRSIVDYVIMMIQA